MGVPRVSSTNDGGAAKDSSKDTVKQTDYAGEGIEETR